MVLMLIHASVAQAQFGGMGGGGMGGATRGGPPGPQERETYQSPVFQRTESGEPVVAVKVTGNRVIDEGKIRKHLQTRAGRDFDPETVRADVRRLSSTGMFRNVRTYRRAVDGGIEVTYEVFELPLIGYLKFVGNDNLSNRALMKRAELEVGQPMQRYSVEEARRKIEELYREKGYSNAQVEIQEGLESEDAGVVFAVYEGTQQRVFRVNFIGNTIASDSRLKTIVKSKPGPLWLFKGKVDRDEIDQDVQRLIAYYRSLGFFRARVGREPKVSKNGKWLTINFVIDEGPRYRIRNVSLAGNSTFTTESLMSRLELQSGEYFDSRRMNVDLNTLRDTYGGEGYIHADIQADPRFLEEPGLLDLVYDIDEGDQYRVGRIIVNIEGDNPHTRRNVVINRLSLAPNDIIDVRKIRNSERRLTASNLFQSEPARGIKPSIAIRPPELSDGPMTATRASGAAPSPPSRF